METLKLTFLMGGLVLLAGCPGTVKDSDTAVTDETDSDTDTDTDTDTDSDTDSDADADYATFAWAVSAGPDEGSFGYNAYPYDYNSNTWDDGTVLCHTDTTLAPSEPYMECAACEFAYSYTGTADGRESGDYCDQFIDVAIPGKGYAEGAGYGLGATSDYAGYGIPAVYLYLSAYPDYEWFAFTFEYAPYYTASISGQSVEGGRIIKDRNTGYPAYSTYTP